MKMKRGRRCRNSSHHRPKFHSSKERKIKHMALKAVNVFTVRILYKSGYYHDFDVLDFKVQTQLENRSFTWKPFKSDVTPILIGANDIAAVWQIKQRIEMVEVTEEPSTGTKEETAPVAPEPTALELGKALREQEKAAKRPSK